MSSDGHKVGSPILFIGDDPARAHAMRPRALSGRPVHLWLPDGMHSPDWADPLRGDPVVSSTFAPLRGTDPTAIVDLADPHRATRVGRALRRALPGAPVLIIDRKPSGTREANASGFIHIEERELLATAVELVLQRATARRRLLSLRSALRGSRRCAFLVQHDPDPDAIASSLALRAALDLAPRRSPIVTCGQVTRPENRRMLEELGVEVRQVDAAELRRYQPLILVDVQPPYFGDALPEVAAVIDHHPPTAHYEVAHRDVRTEYGASATMAAEYLFADEDGRRIDTMLATALLYGITTDTRALTRGASDEDLRMFATLFPRADHGALRRMQHPQYPPVALARLGAALQHARAHGGLVHIHLGRLPADQEHVVAQLAEFCLGVAGARVSVVSGVFGPRIVMSGRAVDESAALGDTFMKMFDRYGGAGGHPMMAKAVLRADAWRADHPSAKDTGGIERTVRAALRRAFSSSAASRAPR